MILWKLLVLLNVLKKFFNTYLDLFFSWFLDPDLDYSWILIIETWFLKTWFLNLWNLLDSWFFGIIKITLEGIASIISPFFMIATLKSRNKYTFFFLVDHSLNSAYSPPLFLNLHLDFLKYPFFSPPLATSKRPKCVKHT